MKAEDLNLKAMRGPAEEALREYERMLDGVRFGNFPDFSLTPEKPNSARTVVPVEYEGRKVGDMNTIVFLPGDGTGDDKIYSLDKLVMPDRLRYSEKPQRVLPRKKEGVIFEGFFPLFSIDYMMDPLMFTTHLEELTVDNVENPTTIVKAWDLGVERSAWQIMNLGLNIGPIIKLTTGYDLEGKRFGDPHAIHYPIDDTGATQVVGFLAVYGEENPLIRLARDWEIPNK